jgi:trans-aconitate methyltransferase
MSPTSQTSRLYDPREAQAFYDARYEHGYMEDYSVETKQRLAELIRSFDLPAKGSALDFGCGNGVLTEVLRGALPGWQICGTDISSTAISNARARFPRCTFLPFDDLALQQRRFDLLFSHHVLEHVSDLHGTIARLDAQAKPTAAMLHVLPCGNAGSFEFRLCALRNDGFDRDREGRFFFEDEGHLRRLTTKQLSEILAERGFSLRSDYYANHLYGSLDWITNWDAPFLRALTDVSRARDVASWLQLAGLRSLLLGVSLSRRHTRFCKRLLARDGKTLKHFAALIAALPGYPVTVTVEKLLQAGKRNEWAMRRRDPRGSEMALYFVRSSDHPNDER